MRAVYPHRAGQSAPRPLIHGQDKGWRYGRRSPLAVLLDLRPQIVHGTFSPLKLSVTMSPYDV